MVDHDGEPSVPEAAPLRFGEILAASAMMPEFGSLPLECWPEYRYSALRINGARSNGLRFASRSFMRALLRFAKITVAALLVAVTRRTSA
jgi:hypothetical protein